MAYNFRPYALDQMYLMPPSISDWVSEGSLARFVSEVVEEMDQEGKLVSIYKRYREDGWENAPYHPLMMVKILVYGYCVSVTSSRRIAQAAELLLFGLLISDQIRMRRIDGWQQLSQIPEDIIQNAA